MKTASFLRYKVKNYLHYQLISRVYFFTNSLLIKLLSNFNLTLYILISCFGAYQLEAQELNKMLSQLKTTQESTAKVQLLDQITKAEIGLKQYDVALAYAKQALELSEKLAYKEGEASTLMQMGDIYHKKNSRTNALECYLQANVIFESLQNKQYLTDSYLLIADLYYLWEIYEKAFHYYEKAEKLVNQSGDEQKKANLYQRMADTYYYLKNYPLAIQFYESALSIYKQQNQAQKEAEVLNALVNIQNRLKNYSQALQFALKRADILQKQANQSEELVETYNNIGFFYKSLLDHPKSLEYCQKALQLHNEKLANSLNANNNRVTIMTNIGAEYLYLGEYEKAQNTYQEALEIRRKQNEPLKIADIYNHIAATDFILDLKEKSITEANQAIQLAEPELSKASSQEEAERVLLDSYKILSEIYQKTGKFKEAKKFYELYSNLKEKIAKREQIQQQAAIQNQVNIERKENEFKLLLADKEKQALSLKQLQLETEQKEKDLALKANELALLKRNQELQASELKNQLFEKERVENLLQLSEQKALAEKRKGEAERQKQETEKQKLLTEKQKIENLQKQKALEASEKEKKAQQAQLEQEQAIKQYGIGLLVIGFLFLLFIFFSLMASQRARRKLKSQNEEIHLQKEEIYAQNEELYQNQEEILAQRDHIERKNKDLEAINKQINSSISAALTIQQAVLPYQEKLHKLFSEYFVIYQPKDVVSGDFYWLNEIDHKTILVAADCTGHGVPGAFMTLIGNTLLDKIIRVWRIVNPAEILNRLHEEITTTLRQHETKNNNGMDAIAISIEKINPQETKIVFSGAKNPLYYISPQDHTLMTLPGDRKSIGGHQNENIHFTNQELILPHESLIYLGSDGLIDQNNSQRIRLGQKKLKQLLESVSDLSLAQQKDSILNSLQEHMRNTSQRDDIMFLGIKV